MFITTFKDNIWINNDKYTTENKTGQAELTTVTVSTVRRAAV